MTLFGKRSPKGTDSAEKSDLDSIMKSIGRSQAVIEFQPDGTIITANENFLKTMGYSLAEVQGRHHSMFVEAQYASGLEYRKLWSDLNAGQFVAGKFQRIGRGGKDVWIRGTYNPVLDASGRTYKVVKLALDITEVEHERLRGEALRHEDDRERTRIVECLADNLTRLAGGDLTARIDADVGDAYQQIKTDFNQAAKSLLEAMKAIDAATGALAGGANEIASAAEDLSRRTEQQAASLEETAAALDQLTATVSLSAEGARKANLSASFARADAVQSGEVMAKAVSAMGEIQHSSQRITQIIGVIDEIAFQTNLLALNAGVEAARAGEAGRGFAVVAQEVRALAQRSAEAAKEIKGLIASSSAQVQQGVQLVADTGSALGGIVAKVTEIDALIEDMAKSTREQASGLSEVNSAVNLMDQVTQQNAAMVEQATAAASTLKAEAHELSRLVGRFQTGGRAPSEGAAFNGRDRSTGYGLGEQASIRTTRRARS